MIGSGRVMDVNMRKAIDIQKKRNEFNRGIYRTKNKTNDYTEKRTGNEKHNRTNLGDSGDYNYRILSSSFCQGRYPLLGMISTSDNPPDLISPLPTRITSTGTLIGEWIGLFVFFLDGNAQV